MLGNKNKLSSLAKRTNNILDVFSKTVESLSQVNMEIDERNETLEVDKAVIEAEQTALGVMRNRNVKVINNINKIIE